MNDTTLHNAKPGDRIYSMVHDRFLTVKTIGRIHARCYIEFEDGPMCTMDGKHYSDKGVQTYFWDKPEVVAPVKPVKPVYVPKNDVLVEVRHGSPDSNWVKRYSAGRISHGMLWCWDDGRTSLTAGGENDTSLWSIWRECKV